MAESSKAQRLSQHLRGGWLASAQAGEGGKGSRKKVASVASLLRGSAPSGKDKGTPCTRGGMNGGKCVLELRSYADRFNDVSGVAHSPPAARTSALLPQRSIKLDRDSSSAGKMDRDV